MSKNKNKGKGLSYFLYFVLLIYVFCQGCRDGRVHISGMEDILRKEISDIMKYVKKLPLSKVEKLKGLEVLITMI